MRVLLRMRSMKDVLLPARAERRQSFKNRAAPLLGMLRLLRDFSAMLTVVRCAAGIMRNVSPMISRTWLAHAAASFPNLNVCVSESSALFERIWLSALNPRHATGRVADTCRPR